MSLFHLSNEKPLVRLSLPNLNGVIANYVIDRLQWSRVTTHLLRTVVLGVFFFMLYTSFKAQNQLDDLYFAFVDQMRSDRLIFVAGSLALVYFNWWLEAVKWQRLMNPVLPMSRTRAYRAVLIGLATSIFTPNRMGEYVGRIIIVEAGKRWQATAALALGSLIQMSFIIALGLISAGYLASINYPMPYFTEGVFFLMAALILILLLIYFKSAAIYGLVRGLLKDRMSWLWKQLLFATFWTSGDLWKIAGLTFVRLCIYVIQYWLLLQFFNINVPVGQVISAILLGYFVQTGLPLPPLLALVARGEIAILIWNYFGVNELSILATSYGLWVINVVLPALIGLMYLIKLKFNRSG